VKFTGKRDGGAHRAAPGRRSHPPRADASREPEWATGLRQLYDSVLNEPLPDAFKDLLDKLDKPK
jgi:hypothetical protein